VSAPDADEPLLSPPPDFEAAREALGLEPGKFGRRTTDLYLAVAAINGNTGRLRPPRDPQADGKGSLADGLIDTTPRPHLAARIRDTLRRMVGAESVPPPPPRETRRWYLRRADQRDQGATPHCVAYTEKHWEISNPTINRRGLPPAEMYRRAKLYDGFPGQDGTTADAMLRVCRELGMIAADWWWTGPHDSDAAIRWVVDVGPLWQGVGWHPSMFRTRNTAAPGAGYDTDGVLEIPDGPLDLGHETCWIGRQRNYKGEGPCLEGVNSWGPTFGILGRFFVRERDFFERWMPVDKGWGDLVGVTEVRL
jgi:hypothetical protein